MSRHLLISLFLLQSLFLAQSSFLEEWSPRSLLTHRALARDLSSVAGVAAAACPAGSAVGSTCKICSGSDGCVCDAFGLCRPRCGFVIGLDSVSPTWRRNCTTCPSGACTCDILGKNTCVDFCALPQNNDGKTGCTGCPNLTGNGCVCAGGQCVDACGPKNPSKGLLFTTPCTKGCTSSDSNGCVCSPLNSKCVPYCMGLDGAQCNTSSQAPGLCRAGFCYDLCKLASDGTVCSTCTSTTSAPGTTCVCSSGSCVADKTCKSASAGSNCTSCNNAYYSPGTNGNAVSGPRGGCLCSGSSSTVGSGFCVDPCNGFLPSGADCGGGAACTDAGDGCACAAKRCRPFCAISANDGAPCGVGFFGKGKCSGGKCVPLCSQSGSTGKQCSYGCKSKVCQCSGGACVSQCSIPGNDKRACFDNCNSKDGCYCSNKECVPKCFIPSNNGLPCASCNQTTSTTKCKCSTGSCIGV